MPDKRTPSVRARQLAAELRRLRDEAQLTGEEAGDRLGWSAAKVSRIETARIAVAPADLARLLDLYEISGQRRERLTALGRSAGERGWWDAYADTLGPEYTALIALESQAEQVRWYAPQIVPGLLQTEEYARAVFRITGHLSGQLVEQRVRLRLERQQILQRSDPPRLWVILDEAVLRRPVGGAEVMRAQLRRLGEAAERRCVTIQVLPFRAGGQPACGRPFTVLRFPGGDLPDVVYLELLDRALYLSKPDDLAYYGDVLAHLAAEADPPIASALMLRHLQPGG